MTSVDISSPKEALGQFFGFTSFKGEQEAIVQSVLDGTDTFVIMPTGGGKSLCYQLPALMSEGTAIVVSPLIALMKNQVDLLRSFGGENGVAHFLNSSLTRGEAVRVKEDILAGTTKLLYVAPESLTKKENVEFLSDIKISFFAIDEAHCISEWGHDFRPEYRRLRTIFNEIKRVPMIALTATATEKVQEDILKNLDIPGANVFKASFNRPNLYYEVRPKKDVAREIIRYVKQHAGRSGIIYCLSRKKVEEIAETLVVNGIKALPYHAGMDAAQRASHQDRFLMEDVDVIVATIAFGMGIDKPDVRFVIHHDIPKSLESYYQETGRGGRDGGEGKCVTFYSYKDIEKLEKFLQGKPVAEQEIGKQLLADTVSYAETGMCRRKYLLHYFGEQLPGDNCGACDNCINPKEYFEAKDDLKLMLAAVKESKERHRARFICDLLTGTETSEIKNYKGDKLKSYGAGNDHNDQHWMAVIRQANVGGYLHKDIESYGNLSLTDKGKEFLKKPMAITFTKERDRVDEDAPDDEVVVNGKGGAADERLMKMLVDLRHNLAKKSKLAPYVIFQENALEEMTVRYPITVEELTQITGVGAGKAQKYGKPFVDLIATYVEENEIERPEEEAVVRSVVKKSSNKVHIIQNIDKRLALESIAKAKNLSMADLLEEMETIVSSGTRLDINYYLEEKLDEDALDEIMDYFRDADSDDLDEALKEFGGDFSEEELRLVRLKFMSEVAN